MEGFSPSARVQVKIRSFHEMPHFSPKFNCLRRITLFMKICAFGKKCAGRGNSSVAQRFLMVWGCKNAESAFLTNMMQKSTFSHFSRFRIPMSLLFVKNLKICTFPPFAPPRAPPQSVTDRQTDRDSTRRPPPPPTQEILIPWAGCRAPPLQYNPRGAGAALQRRRQRRAQKFERDRPHLWRGRIAARCLAEHSALLQPPRVGHGEGGTARL